MGNVFQRFTNGNRSSVGMSGVLGATGSVGGPGISGVDGNDNYKEYLFFCKKDFGFFKSGDYIKMSIPVSNMNNSLDFYIYIKSSDDQMSFTIPIKTLNECFIWGDKLRDKHINIVID
jgi:hypothetical protein